MSDIDEVDPIKAVEKQIDELNEKRKQLIDNTRSDVLETTKFNVKRYNFTAKELDILEIDSSDEDLSSRSSKKGQVQSSGDGNIKNTKNKDKSSTELTYANPADPSQTCHGGQGRKPKWFIDQIKKDEANGISKEISMQRMLVTKVAPLNQSTDVSEAPSNN